MKFLRALIVVLCSFVGIRKKSLLALAPDIKPVHYIVAGLFAALCFILILRTVVKLVMHSAGL
ncbi:MAG: hypothetical protein RLZZ502_1023 [Pseudomonadota bacterium]